MLFRTAHYWLCCTNFNVDEVLAELEGITARVKLAPRPTSKFGPYDYIFIDASHKDWPIDLLLEQLLQRLEPNRKALAKWGSDLTSGVEVKVCTSEGKYSEVVAPETLERLVKLNLQVSVAYEHVSPESA